MKNKVKLIVVTFQGFIIPSMPPYIAMFGYVDFPISTTLVGPLVALLVACNYCGDLFHFSLLFVAIIFLHS
jgi:hypothetical protein